MVGLEEARVTRVRRLEEARRSALKELVRLAHASAANFARGEPTADELLIATQLRRFADFADAVATRGALSTLAAFFEGPVLH